VYFGGNDCIRPHPSGLGPHVPLEEYIENMRKIAIHIMVNEYLFSWQKKLTLIWMKSRCILLIYAGLIIKGIYICKTKLK
jgi:hypothetical protein